MGTIIDLDLVECEVELVCACVIARACSNESSLVNVTPSELPKTTELKEMHRKRRTIRIAIVGSQLRTPQQTMMGMNRGMFACFFPASLHIYTIDIRSTTVERHSRWCFLSSGVDSGLELQFT